MPGHAVTAAAQQLDPYARFVSDLHCGHQARTRGRPRRGQWITCQGGCQQQRRVDAVAATRPRLLDLFCGAGGAGMGYHRAGFEVVGVDINPQSRYPFKFVQADALTFPLEGFDAIHASPPCQMFSIATQRTRGNHVDLLAPTRKRLLAQSAPWVIENVPGAPMRADLKLCGCMFGLGRLQRERWFETSWHSFSLRPPCYHPEPPITITVKGQPNHTGSADEAAAAMGIDWMTSRERGLAIPPAYTEYIGGQLLEHLAAERAA